MSADYNYLSASDGTGDASIMHVTSNRAVSATSISVDSVIAVPTNFIATQGTLLSSGFIDPTTICNFKGHVSGSTLVIDAFEPGSTDTGSTAGQVIVIKPNTAWANDIVTLAKVTHNNDGTLKTGIVGTTAIADGNVTTAKIADSNVTTAKIATGAVTATKMDQTIRSSSPSMGYGLFADLTRIGNIVMVHMNATTTTFAAADGGALIETIPLGYRPAAQASLSAVATAGTTNTRIGWQINTDGSMTYGNMTSVGGNTRFIGGTAWITFDA